MTSIASSDGGPAGSSYARGKSGAGPVLDRAERAAVVAVVDRPERAELVLDPLHPPVLVDLAASPRDCHQTQSWQTDGAVSSVSLRQPGRA